MIQQFNQQPIQQSIQQPICDSASQCSGNGAEYSWLGHGVAVSKAFVKSLIPMEDPCLSFNSRKAVKDLLRLATTTIVPSSSILFMAKDMANAWFGSGLPGPDAKPELPQTSKETREEAQEKEPGSKDVSLQQPSTARYQGSQGAKGLLALGTLASSFQYANSNDSAGDSIPIKDAKDLRMIGQSDDFPMNGTYHQTGDIDISGGFKAIGRGSIPTFTGKYDGGCNTIKGLSDCLVYVLEGRISNLGFTDGEINRRAAGIAACYVEKKGIVNDIWAKNIHIKALSFKDDDVGIGAAVVRKGGCVANITAVGCSVTSEYDNSNVGIGGGRVDKGGTVHHTTAVNCKVKSYGYKSNAGIGGGESSRKG
ncbi:hypothetical protein [Endozoicomonas sp. GU-1]|uniref:hypothetical protein n=1 Tax=Endozoicomonas sp. GU-1 TaxID=3009078 RepID=UPI0022B4E63D|nr:hypothetical protein [Endozoicomonas sp. GU-1]WBA83395.1 hypothetical protein O2T12_09855 [Endozoicomonas sp. GU-1]